eukprot:TRINITY_DN61_c1_g1_i1.p1 TRINITY_DN61_c1_g1~~TRINITY_DN61_c1_g1_i1.p1  ORF type:complete len:210 (+),score=78.43 TRINITY_DN61_c1_g1_i1:35-631(+)
MRGGRRGRAKELPLHKILVVGPGGVGKSALTLQFMYGDFVEEYDPTSADSYRKTETVDGEQVQLDILDTAGQEEYAAMRDNYYRTGEGFLCVYAINLDESWKALKNFHEQILRATDQVDVPFVVCGNKCDLEDRRLVSKAQGEELAKMFKATFFETSAKSNLRVQDAFHQLVRQIKNRKASGGGGKPGAGGREGCVCM